ncbi:hypothetical protein [Leeia sp.]|uniref:hypothetical protein n=1 Tax=Leeia sp. TaxID=2884678 RepID=UPI0035B374B1
MATTHTIGPLHFEDLDPKRFEDLVRQLVYDFKPWRKLEATGRAGSDDGFDARGYEIVKMEAQDAVEHDSDASDELSTLDEGIDDRLWLIQCKREREIGPKPLINYLNDTVLGPAEKLHGLVFAAACDFSKKSRDAFAQKCIAMGLAEWHLWGRAELEDRLFRPENDHLLFAYFGISLTIRRRTQRANLRAKLAMKRKVHRILQSQSHPSVLLRSPNATEYPHIRDLAEFKSNPQWGVRQYLGMSHAGLEFSLKRYKAYLSDDGQSWDAAMVIDYAKFDMENTPWRDIEQRTALEREVTKFWLDIPDRNKAWLEKVGVILFEDIMDIDELGDEYVQAPHIYTISASGKPYTHLYDVIRSIDLWEKRVYRPTAATDGRTIYFPAEFRESPNDSK